MGFFRDQDFLFWAKSKNPENPEILGIGIGILKSLKIPKKSRVKNPENPEIPGIGIRKSRKISSENPLDFWQILGIRVF